MADFSSKIVYSVQFEFSTHEDFIILKKPYHIVVLAQ